MCLGAMGAKVVRNDSLAKFLSTRSQRNAEMDRNLIPQRTEEEKQDFREKINTQLNRWGEVVNYSTQVTCGSDGWWSTVSYFIVIM